VVRRSVNAIGVDVGGTKIAAGVVSREGELLDEVMHTTVNVRELVLSTIAEPPIAEVKRGYEVGGVCLAVPGFILAGENKVLSAANLEAIEDIPLKEELGGWARRVGFVAQPLQELHFAVEFSGCLPSANKGKIRSVR
jgi:predicted NBD/HSP70 family sugar kinase